MVEVDQEEEQGERLVTVSNIDSQASVPVDAHCCHVASLDFRIRLRVRCINVDPWSNIAHICRSPRYLLLHSTSEGVYNLMRRLTQNALHESGTYWVTGRVSHTDPTS